MTPAHVKMADYTSKDLVDTMDTTLAKNGESRLLIGGDFLLGFGGRRKWRMEDRGLRIEDRRHGGMATKRRDKAQRDSLPIFFWCLLVARGRPEFVV